MIPLRDVNPTHRRPYVTYALVALNLIAFTVWQGFPVTNPTTPAEREVVACYGAWPFELSRLEELPFLAVGCDNHSVLLSLFTSMFLHANLLHIGGNMLFLWIFGNNVEDRMGHVMFLLFYLAAGVVAAYTQVLPEPDAQIPLIGASGAIAGTLGAYIVLYPRARILTLVMFFFITFIELPAIVVLGIWFALQFFSGVGELRLPGESAGVAFFAHMGGFVFGVIVAFLFYRRRRAEPQVQQLPPGWQY